MSPSDKIIAGTNSSSGEGQTQGSLKTCSMNSTPKLGSASTSDGSLSGKISSIPLITASLSTLKCSISDKMKTFDPGEESAIKRLTNNHCSRGSNEVAGCHSIANSNSCTGLIKSKNYKAGSKINKLADMLARRSQNVVEVTQNDSSSIISDISVGSKGGMTEESGAANFGKSVNDFQKTANGNELDTFRKSRRKSVPNQSCNFSHLEVQSTSKSCLDLSSLFTMQEGSETNGIDREKMAKPKFNALGESMLKLQTDESTKRRPVRKNLKNVELTLILPEKKRRFSTRNDGHYCKKGVAAEDGKNQIFGYTNETSTVASPVHSVSSTNSRRETRGKQRRSKRLVETSTQTADIEFIALINQKGCENGDARDPEGNKNSLGGTECVRCSQILPLERDCKNQSSKNVKPVIKCQFCSRKLPTVDELKLHYVKKHPNKYVHCLKCVAEEKLVKYSEEIQLVKRSVVGDENTSGTDCPMLETKADSREDKNTEKTPSQKTASKRGDLKIDVSYDGSKKCSVSPRNLQKYSPKEVKSEEQLIEMEMLFYSHLSGNIRENLANHLDGKMGQNGCTINLEKSAEAMEGSTFTGGNQSTKAKGTGSSSSVVPTAIVQEVPPPRVPSPYRTRSKTPNPLPPPTAKKFKKLPNWQQKFWEKYNFPTNYRYEHRFWDKNYLDPEKSALFLKDLSCLDIKTQLTMRENIKKLDSIKLTENENSGGKTGNAFTFPAYLSLVPKTNAVESQPEGSQSSEMPTAVTMAKSRRPSRKELPVTTTKTRKDMLMEAKRQADRVASDGGKVMTRRQNSLDLLVRGEAEESARKRKGSLDLSLDKRMTLRRQTSADNLQRNGTSSSVEKSSRMLEIGLTASNTESAPLSPIGTAEISGEWVKPRSYLCGTCCAKFSNLWDLEDHKWVSHPNVWCTHYEFEDEKIEKLFQMSEAEEEKGSTSSNVLLSDLYKRYLLPHGTLKTAKLVPSTNYPEKCTKCKKNCMNLSEMHKHMLDCGGDTTWFLTMFSSPMTVKRKWRPFGSRRRKQIGRQIKRNIPNTPNIRPYHYQQHRIRTKPGDMESIQKMLANLPEKRARRAINFDEIKTRSQVTIHSNRMLRKRFKSSFANNYLKLKNFNQRRPLKSGKKEGSSKSTTDTSSESTPVASPKRSNKLREAVQRMKEESGADVSNESSNDGAAVKTGKKNQSKKNASRSDSPQVKTEDRKSGKQVRKIREEVKMGKPLTRSRSSASNSPVDRFKRKTNGSDREVQEEHLKDDSRRKATRSTVDLSGESSTRESRVTEISTNAIKGKNDKGHKEKKKKSKTKVKGKKEKEGGFTNGQSDAILRLKHPVKREKTDIVKKMNKTNSKSILEETKEVSASTESPNSSRRSLRLKSLQGEEENVGMTENQTPGPEPKSETLDSSQKNSKIKKSASEEEKVSDDSSAPQRELRTRRSNSGEGSKTSEIGDKVTKSVPEKKPNTKEMDVQDRLRRSSRCVSLRKSVSLEDKVEDNTDKVYLNPPLLRRHSKNISDDAESDDSISMKRLPRLNSFSEERSDSLLSNTQTRPPSVPATRRLSLRGKTKDNGGVDGTEENKNHDLEEMPILAKVEPLQGKLYRKKEEEDIPVLMPAMEVTRREPETEPDDSFSFQIVKKRKTATSAVTASKEVAPLKLVKKIDRSFSKRETTFLLEEESIKQRESRRSSESSKSKKRVSSETNNLPPEVKPCKSCKRCNKYFLGICPCEIDKGKEEEEKENDDSGDSDNEPLITLLNHSQKDHFMSAEKKEKEKKADEEEERVEEDEKPLLEKETTVAPLEEIQIEEKPEIADNLPAPVLTPEKVEATAEETFNLFENKTETTSVVEQSQEKKGKKKKSPTKKEKVVNEKAPALLVQSSEVDKEKKTLTSGLPEITAEVFPERRSRRISKETKSTNEFVIDDPLILVDELWSDLDSDSETSRKKSKKWKKKASKKKSGEERRNCEVDLEELLRNFGENKESNAAIARKSEVGKDAAAEKVNDAVNESKPTSAVIPSAASIVKVPKTPRSVCELRGKLENRCPGKSSRRLSLKLFRFNKPRKNFGNGGQRLSEAKSVCRGRLKEDSEPQDTNLPDLPFLVAEIKENPVQVIQCRAQKPKTSVKKGPKTVVEPKNRSGGCIHLKISLPLESINNLAVFNNNHLTELDVEKESMSDVVTPESHLADLEKIQEEKTFSLGENSLVPDESTESGEMKNKMKRSEVIDKIFYCEICQTYYYSSSQLKIHKLSNRHKIKEAEILCSHRQDFLDAETGKDIGKEIQEKSDVPEMEEATTENILEKLPEVARVVEPEKINEDTLEMPTLEGPFLEGPVTRVEVAEPGPPPPPTPPIANPFKFCQESLKDIQRAIGCTDEEMLILTLLGENTIEIENDILDLDTGKPVQSNKGETTGGDTGKGDGEKTNGLFKVDLKQRMTSALTCLVNKAVFNLLQKYESVAKSSVNPDAVSLLGKLSSLSRRQNILQLNDLLKRQKDGESSVINLPRKDVERKEPTLSYKYQCTICGSRFEKASTRECHISRSHKGKAKKFPEEVQVLPTSVDDDWTDYWTYEATDLPGNTSQFWCSDCGINFVSPQEVLEHQKLEHQAGVKEVERLKDASPLQSSTIGSSDEILLEGKKSKRRSKIFSSEELDKQRIIANNELRKLDRKFSGKNKAGKIKWGMDALKFTIEKEKEEDLEKGTRAEKAKEIAEDNGEEIERTVGKSTDSKETTEPTPKLNFTRTSNIAEFKVIQKNSLKSRFQKIIDNKLKRKGNRPSEKVYQETDVEERAKGSEPPAEEPPVVIDNEQEETETEVMLVPIVVKKKNKKPKPKTKKSSEEDKCLDVYDFNDSESDGEPMVLSHIKKPLPLTTKLKLVKVKEKEEPSKNKADSTTKDLAPDDYDSEDSLPLSIVKKSKSGEEDEKASEDGVEKSDRILEKVEYLIEQLEHDTGTGDKKKDGEEDCEKAVDSFETKKGDEEVKEGPPESLKVSLASSLLTLSDLPRLNSTGFKEGSNEKGVQLAEPETSQSTFDEEDSIPLVLMSRRPEDFNLTAKDENTTDVSTTASEDVPMFREKEEKDGSGREPSNGLTTESSGTVEGICQPSSPPKSSTETRKPFENLNGNVIYCRNESMSTFESDFSNDGLIDSNYEKSKSETQTNEDCLKEVTEKEDVVIVCSNKRQPSRPYKGNRKRVKTVQRRKKDNLKSVQRKKKKRFPLLTATIEENSFRRSEESRLNKEVIVRKIWNWRKLMEESTDVEDDSLAGLVDGHHFDVQEGEGHDVGDNAVDHHLRHDKSQTEVEKELIVNKIWSRKKVDHESESPSDKPEDKSEDVKINQTEVSDEVVIKCGPKTATSPKRRQRSKGSTNEASKETIMRKIWSGKCMFQTKAALKTYDSDVVPGRKTDTDTVLMQSQGKQKKRGRPSRFSTSTKKIRLEEADKDDEDDLDSLLEEIEREQLEKAIRLEFLQLRRSEKGNIEIAKEGVNTTMGLFTETSVRYRRDGLDKKKKRIRRNLSRHPRQSLLKRKKFIKKPIRRVIQREDAGLVDKSPASQEVLSGGTRENLLEIYTTDTKMKSRKHKKHRHKHHHHKHKHKKSKHRKCLLSKHKSKRKSGEEDQEDEDEEVTRDTIKEGPDVEEDEEEEEAVTVRSVAPDAEMSRLIDTICQTIPGQIDPSKTLQLPSPFTFEDSTKDCDEGDEQPSEKERTADNVYEFAEDVTDLSAGAFKSRNWGGGKGLK